MSCSAGQRGVFRGLVRRAAPRWRCSSEPYAAGPMLLRFQSLLDGLRTASGGDGRARSASVARRTSTARRLSEGRGETEAIWHLSVNPAATSPSATYRHPVHRSTANAASWRPANRASQARRCSAVSRADLTALHLSGHGVEVVEGDLLPVDIRPAYDGHRDLLKLRRGAHPPMRIAYAVDPDARLSWGGLPAPPRPQHSTARCMSSNSARSAGVCPDGRPDADGAICAVDP